LSPSWQGNILMSFMIRAPGITWQVHFNILIIGNTAYPSSTCSPNDLHILSAHLDE
jgi:hypothetical protein